MKKKAPIRCCRLEVREFRYADYVRSIFGMMGLSLISVGNVGTEEACDFHALPNRLFGHMGVDVQIFFMTLGNYILTARGRLSISIRHRRSIYILSAIATHTKTQQPNKSAAFACFLDLRALYQTGGEISSMLDVDD